MNIREVTQEDLPELSKLAKLTWVNAFGDALNKQALKVELEKSRSEAYFKQAIEKGDVILLAEDNGKLIGYVQFGNAMLPEIEAKEGDKQFHRLYVDTDMQNKGVGTELTEAALKHPLLAQAKNIYLQVWDQNTRAVHLYEKFGFEKMGTTKVVINENTTFKDLIMVLRK